MELILKKISLRWIQVIGWALFYGVSVVYMLPQDPWKLALLNPLMALFSYLLIIYGNALWLIPQWYEKRKYAAYTIALFVFFVAVTALRMVAYHAIYFKLLGEKFFDYSFSLAAYLTFSTFLILCISFLFRLALNYFQLLKTQEQLKAQHYQTELNLLKSQIQPHFLFNTLNNIYYEAYKEAPVTASLIEKLSQVMRYFIDDCPKDTVPLAKEIQFITHYIELEKIRMRYPLQLSMHIEVAADACVPPMLLMPLVENVFKHGIDKRQTQNEVTLSLTQQSGNLYFVVRNPLISRPDQPVNPGGFGLKNLRERLRLIYGDTFVLTTTAENDFFVATLRIPVYENYLSDRG
jgi:sensor histidine kinase YesM